MQKIKKILSSSHVKIALASAFSMISIGLFSTYILLKPVAPMLMLIAIPPIIEALYETLYLKYRNAKFLKDWYWVVGILLATLLVIALGLLGYL